MLKLSGAYEPCFKLLMYIYLTYRNNNKLLKVQEKKCIMFENINKKYRNEHFLVAMFYLCFSLNDTFRILKAAIKFCQKILLYLIIKHSNVFIIEYNSVNFETYV